MKKETLKTITIVILMLTVSFLSVIAITMSNKIKTEPDRARILIEKTYKMAEIEARIQESYYDTILYNMKKVSKSEYKKGEYTCLDFSKDLVKELEEMGIRSRIILGDADIVDVDIKSVNHAWVAVEINPQEGRFIEFGSKFRALDSCSLDKSGKVICNNGRIEGRNTYVHNK